HQFFRRRPGIIAGGRRDIHRHPVAPAVVRAEALPAVPRETRFPHADHPASIVAPPPAPGKRPAFRQGERGSGRPGRCWGRISAGVAAVRVRLGYAAIALDVPAGSPNRTLRAATLAALPDDEARRYRLRQVAAENLRTTLRILRYNVAEGIPVYRLTSRLIPFATHPRWSWDWEHDLAGELAAVRRWVARHRLRLSVHLDHFVVLNSSSPDVRA